MPRSNGQSRPGRGGTAWRRAYSTVIGWTCITALLSPFQ